MPSLIGVMSLKNGVQYAKDQVFSRFELATLTPDHIAAFMRLKVYGTPHPEEDANTTHGCSSSIAYAKKVVSFFLPNSLMT